MGGIIKQVVNVAVPELLERLRTGDESVLNQLVAALYDELRRIAARHLRKERSEHTLQTTALVHEAYMKLCGQSGHEFKDRVHFLSVASRVMRQVLVDYARARATQKRGGDGLRLEVDTPPKTEHVQLLDLHRALDALAQEDENLARVVEMKYFGGMTAEETANALGQSPHVVRHDLQFAEAWLRRKLQTPN
jgi:RNA polymerase sigma factor (TIGR02999 family)